MAALLFATTLTACGAPAATTATSPHDAPLDACALISADEAAAALGTAIQPAHHGNLEHAGDGETAAVSTCDLAAQDQSSGRTAPVMIRRAPGAQNSPGAIAAVRETARELANREPADIAGLGGAAAAYLQGRPPVRPDLHLRRGGRGRA